MDDIYDLIYQALTEHDGGGNNELAAAIGDLIIDLAGHGQLLAAIDRVAR